MTDSKQNKNNKKNIISYMVCAFSIGLFISILFLQITRDTSLSYNVWVVYKKPVEFQKGDYVMFKYLKEDRYIYGKKLIKRITCVPGEYLKRINNAFYCNDIRIADVIMYDKSGNKLPDWFYDGKIPDGYYFVQGTHERSYDSRYFGLIKYEEIQKKAFPITKFFGL